MRSLNQYIIESREAVLDIFEIDGTLEKDWRDLFAEIEDGEPEDYGELSKILVNIHKENFKGKKEVVIKCDSKYNKKASVEEFNLFPTVDIKVSSKRFTKSSYTIPYYIDKISYSKESIRITYQDKSNLYIIFK